VGLILKHVEEQIPTELVPRLD